MNATVHYVTWDRVDQLAAVVAKSMALRFAGASPVRVGVYAIPSGGIFAAMAVSSQLLLYDHPRVSLSLVEDPDQADIYIDDIIDSGDTRRRVLSDHGERPFYALVDKSIYALVDKSIGVENKGWFSFPWERMKNESGPEDNVRRLLEYIGEDPSREGLQDTPRRVVKSYSELFSGYGQDPSEVLRVFKEDSCDEMVILKGVEFCSTCEHHMLPFFGVVHIAYIPDGRLVGVSKLIRVLEIYSRRLQIQERLTEQITRALDEHLEPKGSACVIRARHLCMIARGVQKQNSEMITSSLTGVFREDSSARLEFLDMIGV